MPKNLRTYQPLSSHSVSYDKRNTRITEYLKCNEKSNKNPKKSHYGRFWVFPVSKKVSDPTFQKTKKVFATTPPSPALFKNQKIFDLTFEKTKEGFASTFHLPKNVLAPPPSLHLISNLGVREFLVQKSNSHPHPHTPRPPLPPPFLKKFKSLHSQTLCQNPICHFFQSGIFPSPILVGFVLQSRYTCTKNDDYLQRQDFTNFGRDFTNFGRDWA